MATVKGTAFRVYVNTGTVGSPVYAAITGEGDVTLSVGAGTIEVTTKDSAGWDEFVKGNMNWSVAFNGKWIASDPGALDARSDLMTVDATSLIQIKTIDSTKIYSGTCIVEKLDLKAAYNGVVEDSLSFKGTGALAYA